MAPIIDILAGSVFGGLLLLSALRLNIFVASTQQQSTLDGVAQQNCVQLGEIIENDIYKAGSGLYPNNRVFNFAAQDSVQINGDVNDDGVIDIVTYKTGPKSPTTNPNQRFLYRTVNGVTRTLNLGLTKLKLTYFSYTGAQTTNRDSVSAVKVSVEVESDYRMVTAGSSDTVYNGVHWEQYIVPKRLHF